MGTPKHGHTSAKGGVSPEYNAWHHMLQRCNNPKNKNYNDYGGRGITVCWEWHKFTNFLRDVGLRPSPLFTLERIKNDQGYFPGNVKWATMRDQNRNSRWNKWLTYGTETMIIEDWARRFGVSSNSIRDHFKRGRSMEWIVEHFQQKAALAEMRKP